MIYKCLVGGKTLIISNLTQKTSTLLLQSLQKSLFSDAEFVCFSYKVGNLPLYPTNNIILELQPNVAIFSVLQMFGSEVTLEKTLKYDSYLLKVNQISRLLDIANQIYTSGLVKYAHPDFIAPIEKSNPLYPQQYHLNNTGQNGGTSNIDINAPEAWALLQNCNSTPRVRVAVIDDGVETHEDLNNLLPNGYTPLNSSGNGRPQGDCFRGVRVGHGQACAGIIGADNNGLGIRGVATNVDILPINIFIGDESFADRADAINWAWDIGEADVLNNSWAYATTEVLSDAIVVAIQRARTLGRSGKGSIVVFASGNYHQRFLGVTFPANVEGVITVGAINNVGSLLGYSSRGVEMDLVALSGEGGPTVIYGNCITGTSPNGIATLDRMGASGYETGNYKLDFNGTSAACPQVAGVAALMLQANSNLTEVQVRTILQQTARDLGATGFDNDTGYGLVDAQAAVTRILYGNAPVSIISGTTNFCSGNSGFYSLSQVPLGATITWQVTGAISLVSGQFTPNISVLTSGSGNGTVQATITTCASSYQTAAFNVFVNSRGLEVNYIYNNGSSIRLNLSNQVGGVSYVNNLCLGYTSNGYLVATIPSGSSVTFTALSGLTTAYRNATSVYFTLSPGGSGIGYIRVTSTSVCGIDTQEMAFRITNCGTPSYPGDPNPTDPCNNPPRLYNISPNPASEQIKIGIADRGVIPIQCPTNPNPKINAMNAVIDSKEGITFSEVNIYNSFGMLVLSKQTNKAKEFTIPLKTLKTGLYLVQISEGEHVERHQVIIE